jgi:hypothetical protein
LKNKKATSPLPNHKLNPHDFLASVAIELRQVARSQALHLTLPSGIRDFDVKHAIGELQDSRSFGYDGSADQRPGERRGFARRSAPKRAEHNFFQTRACLLQN